MPSTLKLCLNGHAWAKRQLRQRGVAFQALDNGFLSCTEPTTPQEVCDYLLKLAGNPRQGRGQTPQMPGTARKKKAETTAVLEAPPLPVTPAQYADFVRQIELTDIWLARCSVENHYGPGAPAEAKLQISSHDTFEIQPDGFDAYVEYRVAILDVPSSDMLGVVLVEFGTHFLSPRTMTPELFAVFSRANLPVNTWPYLREFVQTITARMNWQAVTLPAYKVNVGAGEQRSRGEPSAEEADGEGQTAAAARNGQKAPKRRKPPSKRADRE